MFGISLRRFSPFPFLQSPTGAHLAVATPRWKDLAARANVDPAGLGWDLVRDPAAAGAPVLHLFGQVMDFDGEPVEDVTIEIWQDAPGGQSDPDSDDLPAGLTSGFAEYGTARSNRFGGYRFRTVLPTGHDHCPPHIDARLRPATGRVLATRLYLLDDPRNDDDWHFASLGPSRQAAVMLDPVRRTDGEWEAGFNFVI